MNLDIKMSGDVCSIYGSSAVRIIPSGLVRTTIIRSTLPPMKAPILPLLEFVALVPVPSAHCMNATMIRMIRSRKGLGSPAFGWNGINMYNSQSRPNEGWEGLKQRMPIDNSIYTCFSSKHWFLTRQIVLGRFDQYELKRPRTETWSGSNKVWLAKPCISHKSLVSQSLERVCKLVCCTRNGTVWQWQATCHAI